MVKLGCSDRVARYDRNELSSVVFWLLVVVLKPTPKQDFSFVLANYLRYSLFREELPTCISGFALLLQCCF